MDSMGDSLILLTIVFVTWCECSLILVLCHELSEFTLVMTALRVVITCASVAPPGTAAIGAIPPRRPVVSSLSSSLHGCGLTRSPASVLPPFDVMDDWLMISWAAPRSIQ